MDTSELKNNGNKMSLKIDLRIIALLLVAVIVAMLLVWKPWVSTVSSGDRTVEVTGESTLSASPDVYTFNPSYEFKNSDKAAALADATKNNDEVVAKLKTLGVADSKIKSSTDSTNYPVYPETITDQTTYTTRLTIEVGNRQLAQKVQDYLVTTKPQGAVTPAPTFSESKKKQLESKARGEATKDARAKADQSAENLGFKVGKVKTVSDGAGFNIRPYAMDGGVTTMTLKAETAPQLTVQPGENDLNYSVTVVYYVR